MLGNVRSNQSGSFGNLVIVPSVDIGSKATANTCIKFMQIIHKICAQYLHQRMVNVVCEIISDYMITTI